LTRDTADAPRPGVSSLIAQWKETQRQLRERMEVRPLTPLPRYVAGADAAFSADKKSIFAVALVYDRKAQRVIEVSHVTRAVEAPYIPGFLSFREGPAVSEAVGKLKHPFGVVCFDGQGYAHPRRCGFASHVSISLGVAGVGVAKSRLIGTYEEPAPEAGASSPLMDKDEQIGLVLRTKRETAPLFISIGNRVDLPTAAALVLACCTKYRVPEPTRQADIEVAKLKATRCPRQQ
jgi:deoxyribonuclease V